MITSGREVRIDPLGKIESWTANDIDLDGNSGRLYVPKENSIDVAGIFANFNRRGPSRFEKIGEGDEGIVYRVGNYALKDHCYDWEPEHTLPTLRATRILEMGLDDIHQPDKHAYRMRGIRTHGWFSPVEGTDLLLMEFVQPAATLKSKDARSLPGRKKREKLYNKAVGLFGVDPSWVHFDDTETDASRGPVNIMISRIPSESERGVAVKHDIIAYPEDFQY